MLDSMKSLLKRYDEQTVVDQIDLDVLGGGEWLYQIQIH